ncbi:hypothetical protein BC831DRAFT_497659 [Entophlyctis helioformis]|nr:hypothetical protein BC831DRAFT_497659 [Entophlyctis helioformis]
MAAATPRTYQCALYGELPHTSLGKLLERMVGLCGDTLHQGSSRFCEHDICFIPTVETPFGPSRNDDMVLRLRSRALDPSTGAFIDFPSRQWTLSHLSPPEPPKPGSKLATHRAVYQVPIQGDVFQYMSMLGYRFNFEYVSRGYQFTHGRVTITIFRVYRVRTNSTSWVVQVTSPIVAQDQVVRTSDELFEFANHVAG